MILMHYDRYMRIHLKSCQDQMAQEKFSGIGTGTGRALHDDRAVGFISRLHDGVNLLHIIYIECRHP